jgi:hypothetical protein
MQQPYLVNLTMPESTHSQKEEGNLLLVFQHHTSEIRWMQRDNTGTWRGGSAYDVVASDAKNATPITLLATGPKGVQQHHVFCGFQIILLMVLVSVSLANWHVRY